MQHTESLLVDLGDICSIGFEDLYDFEVVSKHSVVETSEPLLIFAIDPLFLFGVVELLGVVECELGVLCEIELNHLEIAVVCGHMQQS